MFEELLTRSRDPALGVLCLDIYACISKIIGRIMSLDVAIYIGTTRFGERSALIPDKCVAILTIAYQWWGLLVGRYVPHARFNWLNHSWGDTNAMYSDTRRIRSAASLWMRCWPATPRLRLRLTRTSERETSCLKHEW